MRAIDKLDKLHGAEQIMNHTIETNVVETEASDFEVLFAKQAQEAFVELNASQLMLIGGGTTVVLD
jgi:hypothetical protein